MKSLKDTICESLRLGKGSRVIKKPETFNVGDEVWYLKRFAPSRYSRALRYKPTKGELERVTPHGKDINYKIKGYSHVITSCVFATEEDAREFMKDKNLIER